MLFIPSFISSFPSGSFSSCLWNSLQWVFVCLFLSAIFLAKVILPSVGLKTFISPVVLKIVLFYLFIYLNWGMVALQCCVSFCRTTKRISYMYTYIPSLLDLPPTPPPSHPSRSTQSTKLSSLLLYSRFPQIGRARVGKECRSRWSPYH